MTWSHEERRAFAITNARERRRAELEPLRIEVDDAISRLGWRRARPVVERVMGFPIRSQRGAWWSRVGMRNGSLLLKELSEPGNDASTQLRLFELPKDRAARSTKSDRHQRGLPASTRVARGEDGPRHETTKEGPT